MSRRLRGQLVGLESSVREAVGGIAGACKSHEDGGWRCDGATAGVRAVGRGAAIAARSDALPLNMNDVPTRIDPEEAAIGRPTATAAPAGRGLRQPEHPAGLRRRRLARRPRAPRHDPGRVPRRAARRRPRLVERLDGGRRGVLPREAGRTARAPAGEPIRPTATAREERRRACDPDAGAPAEVRNRATGWCRCRRRWLDCGSRRPSSRSIAVISCPSPSAPYAAQFPSTVPSPPGAGPCLPSACLACLPPNHPENCDQRS